MKRIGIISDTHGYWDERYRYYFEPCDEIWHAGDIGTMEIAEKLAAFRTLRAVHGNIDTEDIRRKYPERLRWKCEDVDVLMTHIGGYPGNYEPSPYQSRSSRHLGMAQRQDPRKTHHRTQ